MAATFARLLARSGSRVVAIDADSNPNLAIALGVDPQAAQDAGWLPSSLVSRKLAGPALTAPIDTVLERYAVSGPDGVRLLLMGMPEHAEQGCLCSAHATVSGVLADLRERVDTVVVVDMEASPEHLSRGTARHADVLLLVAEPYFRSLESVRRLAQLAAELPIPRVEVVANKVRSAEDAEAIVEFCRRHDLPWLDAVPWSSAVLDADAAMIPLLDALGTTDVVDAIARFSARLVDFSEENECRLSADPSSALPLGGG